MSHNNKIRDTETHFVIDPATRAITNASPGNNIIVQYDHNSERFTFEIPKEVDGHDMSESTEVRIHYRNASSANLNKTNGVYIPDDLAVDANDPSKLTFSWLISSSATQYIGYLYFSISFVCLNGGNVEYAWNTGIYKDITVIESIQNVGEMIAELPDTLKLYKQEIISALADNIDSIIQPRIDYITLSSSSWVGTSSPYSQVVTINGVTANSQVDLTPSVQQLAVFYEKDLTFVTENNNGVVTVYAIGQKPQNTYTIQVTITEVG